MSRKQTDDPPVDVVSRHGLIGFAAFYAFLFVIIVTAQVAPFASRDARLGITVFALVFGAIGSVAVWSIHHESKFVRGTRRMHEGTCPNCAYPQRDVAGRCPECGWPPMRADAPLCWPLPSQISWWPWRSKVTTVQLYLRWALTLRACMPSADFGPDPVRVKLADVICRACASNPDLPNRKFMPQDDWRAMSWNRHAAMRLAMERAGLRLSHRQYASLGKRTFGEVLDEVMRFGVRGDG